MAAALTDWNRRRNYIAWYITWQLWPLWYPPRPLLGSMLVPRFRVSFSMAYAMAYIQDIGKPYSNLFTCMHIMKEN